ncbi:hypothetical protein BDY21DRAFT_332973 [Lineolata rhizophorae]|uniref:Uncharacterized protein n=1 Tax=Lineolata rhizophorae TaxID=578093 RepID=A0A6A6PE68_9PEZI|nr:hypothetical protein BDY21DRAFT_332973 [Lineolata rhizophorae]
MRRKAKGRARRKGRRAAMRGVRSATGTANASVIPCASACCGRASRTSPRRDCVGRAACGRLRALLRACPRLASRQGRRARRKGRNCRSWRMTAPARRMTASVAAKTCGGAGGAGGRRCSPCRGAVVAGSAAAPSSRLRSLLPLGGSVAAVRLAGVVARPRRGAAAAMPSSGRCRRRKRRQPPRSERERGRRKRGRGVCRRGRRRCSWEKRAKGMSLPLSRRRAMACLGECRRRRRVGR